MATDKEYQALIDSLSGECERLHKENEELKALSQEPCDDAISRESVDRILRDMGVHCAYDMPSFWANKGKDYKVIPTKWHKGYQQAVADFDKRIRELPSVTQKSKTGHWIYTGDYLTEGMLKCSECGEEIDVSESYYDFCPVCGARMVEPQESEKINCKSTKCDKCINHNYCDYEPQERSDKE